MKTATQKNPLWAAALLVGFGWLTPALAGDPAPAWQPMLGKSLKADKQDIIGLVVYQDPGCVFLLVEGKGVFCSPAGAKDFKPVTESWKDVRAHAERVRDARHLFVLSDSGIKES